MKFQAILLSLIILVSILISGSGFSSGQSEVIEVAANEENKQIEEIGNPTSVFIKDLYSVVSRKTVLIGETLSENLSVMKESFSVNTQRLFSRNSEPVLSSPYAALISKAEINRERLLPCTPSEEDFFTSRAVLIRDLDYNFNVFELNAEKRWPIASLSKMMTALVAVDKMGWDREVTVSEKAVSTEGTSGGLQAGEVYSVKDLIEAMLVVSSNDAAMAIAEDFGEKEFIDEMQKKAAGFKMLQTSYLESTGLSYINQSTVEDLAKLMTYVYSNYPELLEISSRKETYIKDLKSGRSKRLFSINKFAGDSDFIGGKTGYIEEAGRNLMALFEINGKPVLTITLGADDSFAETEKLKEFVLNCSNSAYEQSE